MNCDVVWVHTVTRASLGVCGKETNRLVHSRCPRCNVEYDASACDVCWASHKYYGLCGTCLTPLELREAG